MKLSFKLFFLCWWSMTALSFFDNDRAARAYRDNDLSAAQNIYNKALIEDPSDYQALYNAGKIAYKQGTFELSEAYFSKALECPDLSSKFQEQAFFDWGNSQAQLKKWLDALKSFEEVLKLNPDNDYARKTIERLKEIIEQEKQKEEQKQEQDQKKDQEKDKEQDKEKDNDNQDQEDKNNDQKNKDDDSQGDNKQQDQQNKNQSKDNEQKDNKNSNQQDQNQQQNKEQQSKKEEDRKDDAQGAEKQDKEQLDKAAEMEQQEKENKEKLAASEKKSGEKEDTSREMMLVRLVENSDAAMSKMLLQKQINKEEKRDGQKNW